MNMKFTEYVTPEVQVSAYFAANGIMSNSPGTSGEKIGWNDDSVGDDDEFNW